VKNTSKRSKKGAAILGAVGIITGLAIAAGLGLSSSGKVNPGVRQAESLQDAFVSVSETLAPSVVNISTEQVLKYRYYGYNFNDLFDRFFNFDDALQRPREKQYKRTGLGTGLIVSEDGYILTNFHVIKEMTKITVILSDKTSYTGRVTGVNKARDLALVKIDPGRKLVKAVLGDSSKVRVGQWAVAVGNPFGYDHTVTAGIVSAIGRVFEDSDETGVRKLPNLIQTDAAINPGNSGGPLANIFGEVIGINVAIVSTSGSYAGIGFAIPVNDARAAIDEMMKSDRELALAEKSARPSGRERKQNGAVFLGVHVADLTPDLIAKYDISERAGAVITGIDQNGRAISSGLNEGDLVIEAEKQQVKNSDDFAKITAKANQDNGVLIVIKRSGKIMYTVLYR